ncbi:MAG TPA: bifunctional phosphoribosylaminoimidazolecarboxamide formyltransferase/IMP cyclohydrolase [Steroidobacteraceae bacterium]|jgi:phosphoribosylaminoimidazolecarboxamide formyltransferase/IMP cyclohydrolase|nr:bifunctional phosphoribosylaminoimidazolecarboxamide formyltransferase/IMP cyclohydrolase [Steroidobacteraceae bacterium]
MPTPRRALLSVSDKRGLAAFAAQLHRRGIELLSTGGTAALLADAGVPAREVAEYTGFPELMGGRLKTLHPRVHGGLLGRRGVDDAIMQQHGILPIDLLVVNLYPFAATIARADATYQEAIENIDVGGPAMLRAAAKNHADVTVVVDPDDYDRVLGEIDAAGETSIDTRAWLAAKAFAHTARYDALIAGYLQQHESDADAAFPDPLILCYDKLQDLRYGENPHQRAAFYRVLRPGGASVTSARVLQGKELSYNNIVDADTAIECVRRFADPCCVIVKHANPCGVALGAGALQAYESAYRTDPAAAFGGIIAFNHALDEHCARAIIGQQFAEVIAAPAISAEALAVFADKAAALRLLETGDLSGPPDGARGERGAPDTAQTLELRSVTGGLLLQQRDADIGGIGAQDLKVVSRRRPDERELSDLLFAWQVAQFVKSNAIVLARDGATIGVGGGQMSRVYSVRIAALKALDEQLPIHGAVMASDAFFPFRDGIDVAASHGIAAVIHPGGSKRDAEVIAAADEHGMAMVMTGVRHFRH